MKNFLILTAYKFYKLKEDILAKLFLKAPNTKSSTEKKLLIVKTDAIGDYIIFRNFLKEIRESRKYRKYKIYILGNIIWKDIFDNLDKKYIDDAKFLNLRTTKHGGNKYRKKILSKFTGESFDTIIYSAYSRNSIMDILINKINAKNKIAFSGDDENMSYFEKYFTDKIYTKLIKTNKKFEFDRNKDFFEQVLEEKINFINPKINIKKKKKNYFVINPGASVKFKQWLPENFAKVSDYLIEKYKSKVYIVGSKSELELDNKVRNFSKHKNKIEIKSGEPLYSILTLMAESRGIICNESGAPHIAVALGKKIYCISGKLGYIRMHPYPNYKNAIYCYPPNLDKIKNFKHWYENAENLNTVTPESVISKLKF
jgi:ADP-heptose:LPS heptosyltransferase